MGSAGKTQKRTVLAHIRNAVATPLAGVATTLYVAWQLITEQQLFLRTFLSQRIGKPGVPILPLGYANVLALKSIMLCQHLSNNPDAFRDIRRRTELRILRRLQDHNIPRRQVLPILEYRAGEIDPSTFTVSTSNGPFPAFCVDLQIMHQRTGHSQDWRSNFQTLLYKSWTSAPRE